MKIYFEDGRLVDLKRLPIVPDYVIEASDGVSENINFLHNLSLNNQDCIVYTNSILALDNRWGWNDQLHVPEIFLRDNEHGCFMNITAFTNRQIKQGHNLARMYISGEFNKCS